MACPYFMPVEKLENGNWLHPFRLPLGSGWRGHCTAPGHADEIPPQDVLEKFCNLGYSGSCTWVPQDRAWDAVRFAISAPLNNEKSLGNSPRVLRLKYVCERDHLPAEHGELQFDLCQQIWLTRQADPRLHKMAECFLESYLKKRV